MDRFYERLKVKVTDDDRFNMLYRLLVQSMDPHTDYSPGGKKIFDEQRAAISLESALRCGKRMGILRSPPGDG